MQPLKTLKEIKDFARSFEGPQEFVNGVLEIGAEHKAARELRAEYGYDDILELVLATIWKEVQ